MADYSNTKPKTHYTVLVKVVEVTPAYRTGNAPMAATFERQTEDALTLSVRGKDLESAINQAVGLLETAREGRDRDE